jgi:tRNA(Ile)-lysidine synthase
VSITPVDEGDGVDGAKVMAAAGLSVALAYSGGRDSTALLHATLQVARELGVQVHALHVHHGLSRHADAWLQHCRETCERWAGLGWPVSFHARRVVLDEQGQGIEAAARQARYIALRDMAVETGCDLVLLAHHREDQAETVLLQALRGAGVAGLAAMPRQVRRDGVVWARPWLQHARTEVQAHVDAHGLSHIEDDSNADRRFARNRLRLDVWPAVAQGFDGAAQALGLVARHAHEAAECLSALADIDLQAARCGDGLALEALGALSESRRANALRHWLAQRLGRPVPVSLMQRLLTQVDPCRSQSWPVAPGQVLRLYRGVLSVERTASHQACVSASSPTLPPETQLHIDAPGAYPLPDWGGSLKVLACATGQGTGAVDLAQLGVVELRGRSGGEQFQWAPGRPARSLKKQYQAAGVPTWARGGPILWSQGRLLFVPGLGVDGAWHDAAAQQPCHLRWCPDDATNEATGPAR